MQDLKSIVDAWKPIFDRRGQAHMRTLADPGMPSAAFAAPRALWFVKQRSATCREEAAEDSGADRWMGRLADKARHADASRPRTPSALRSKGAQRKRQVIGQAVVCGAIWRAAHPFEA
jgi:hypothetical protein